MATALERFVQILGYPGSVPAGARTFTLVVDGGEIEAEERDGRLVLTKALCSVEGGEEGSPDLAALAGYAAGRMLKEEAVLAWDAVREVPILWQDVAAGGNAAQFRRFFEVFAASCDWWEARVREVQDHRRVPEMMIVP